MTDTQQPETRTAEAPFQKLTEEKLKELCLNSRYKLWEVTRLHEEFWEKCPEGKLPRDDLIKYVDAGDENNQEKFCKMFLEYKEVNKDGFLGFEDAFEIVSVMHRSIPVEKLHYLFEFFDTNKDGYISEEELIRLVEMYETTDEDSEDQPRSSKQADLRDAWKANELRRIRQSVESALDKVNENMDKNKISFDDFFAACKEREFNIYL